MAHIVVGNYCSREVTFTADSQNAGADTRHNEPCEPQDFMHDKGGIIIDNRAVRGKKSPGQARSFQAPWSCQRCLHLTRTPPTCVCNSSDGVGATDPASARPGRLIAHFAMLWVCRCANSVPTKLRETLAERGWEGRRPSCHCPKNSLTGLHIWQSKRRRKMTLPGVPEKMSLIDANQGHRLADHLRSTISAQRSI